MSSSVTVDAIREARAAIRGVVRETPVWPSLLLSGVAGVPVLLKCE